MIKIIYLILVCTLVFPYYSTAQIVFEPISNVDIYNFLNRLAQKGVIEFYDNIKPVSRKYISEKLEELKQSEIDLTSLEKEELEFYLKEYGVERLFSNEDKKDSSVLSIIRNDRNILFGYDKYDRWRLFSYSSDLFKVNVSPVLGIELGKNDGAKQTHIWNGVSLYGYITDKIGFSFYFRDNDETGDNIDRTKAFTPETGVIVAKGTNNGIQYSEVHANISTDWSWGEITIGKDFLNWGYGKSGLLVLSDKAPSFPFIRLDINPTDWLHFNYIHGWLSSGVVDSSASYLTYVNSSRDVFRNKYLASHTLTLTPIKGLDVSIGESIIYSDNLEISYLMPIMFFRLADHYLSYGKNDAGSNSQFFFGISSRNHLKNTQLYGTWFIDEFTLSDAFDSQKQRNQFGYTLGASVTDLPVDNVTFTIEYTRINPFVYSHYIPTQSYESSSYPMGHWMGYNTDLIYGSINYRFIRGLQTTLWTEFIRKGSSGMLIQQYEQPQPPFLFGLKNRYTYWGLDIKYEIIPELFLRGKFQSSHISNEQSSNNFVDNTINMFSFSIYYGL